MKGFYDLLKSMLPVNKGERFAELSMSKFNIGFDNYPVTADIEIVLNEEDLSGGYKFIDLKIMADGKKLFGYRSTYDPVYHPTEEARDSAAYNLVCHMIKMAFYNALEERRTINISSGECLQ